MVVMYPCEPRDVSPTPLPSTQVGIPRKKNDPPLPHIKYPIFVIDVKDRTSVGNGYTDTPITRKND